MPSERRGVGWAFAWFFFALLSYFIVRPVRETMGITGGTKQLPWLFTATFLAMLAAVPVYSALVARLPRRWLVRAVYHFFAASLILFCLLMQIESERLEIWTARVFFVWVNVFAFYNTSIFWSVLADLFHHQQAKRLFGLIAAGGTLGAISGSVTASLLAKQLSTGTLILLPMVLIELGLMCAWRLEKQSSSIALGIAEETSRNGTAAAATETTREEPSQPIAGGLLAGITHVLRSPYLVAICVFLFFVQVCGTQLYSQQAEIVNATIQSDDDRTALFANIDLGTQLIALFTQAVLAGPILRRLGVSVALVILPVVYFVGFGFLAANPTLAVIVFAMITTRAATYGIAVPSREVLFTVVSREDKYKSKNFIDTVLARGGDALSMQIFGKLQRIVSMPALALWMLPLTVAWMLTAWRLGQRQRQLANEANGRRVADRNE
jgi:AAA family ATP:ADP antiporter